MLNLTNKKLALLATISEAFAAASDYSRIVNSLNQHISSLIPTDCFLVGILDEEKQVIRFDIPEQAQTTQLSISIKDTTQPVIASLGFDQPLLINMGKTNLEKDIDISQHCLTLAQSSDSVSSSIYYPLVVNNRKLGVMCSHTATPNAYLDSEQQLLHILANMTTMALNQILISQEVKKQRSSALISDRHVQTISEIGKEINSTLDLETVLWTVYQHVNKLMDATVFGIGLYDSQKQIINIDLAMEKGQRYQPYTRTMEVKNQFPVWCIENKEVVFINDIRSEGTKYFTEHEYEDPENTRPSLKDSAYSGIPISLIYVPMMLNDKVYGFITVQAFKTNTYKRIHIDILKTIAGYTVNAIANARAHQQLEQTKEDLRLAKKDAEKTAESKMRFLANMSHEIRTPMNIILGFMGVVLEHNQLKTDDKKHLDMAYIAAKNLLVIIDDILDITKNESGKLVIESTPFNLFQMMTNIGSLLSFQAKEKRMEFILDYAPDLAHCFVGDPVRISQIILNLAGNAIKFTDTGSIEIKVKDDGESNLLFSVKDTGIGIPEEKQARIFEVFTQADSSTTRNFGGTGLGTTISRQLVEAMGGEIWLTSEVNKGSNFYFKLPLKKAIPTEVEMVSKANDEQSGVHRKFNVLLAEDTIPNAILMSVVMKKKGHQLTIVENGLQAVKAVGNGNYDVVLMDVQMPVMDGLTATRKIRNLSDPVKNSIPIIAMTASALQEDRDACFAAGMNKLQPKPVDFKALFLTLNKLIK